MTSTSMRGWIILAVCLLATILVPFVLFEAELAAVSEAVLSGRYARASAALGIVGLLAADSLLPVPSSLLATASGALLGFWMGGVVSWIGLTAGMLAGYWLGWTGGSALARRLVGEASLRRARKHLMRYGAVAVVLSRPIPVLAEAIVILAGTLRMPLATVLLLASLANAGVALVYAAIGRWALGADSFLLAFLGAVAVPILAAAVFPIWRTLGPRLSRVAPDDHGP